MNGIASLQEKKPVALTGFFLSLTALAVFIVYLAPFWWPNAGSGWKGIVRIVLLAASIYWLCIIIGNRARNGRYKIFHDSGFLLGLYVIFFIYLLVNALILGDDLQPVRRVFLLATLFVSVFFLDVNNKNFRNFALVVSIVGACFALYSLFHLYSLDRLPTAYRTNAIFESGTSSIASFGNTIIAGMHFSVSFLLLFYLFLTEKNKYLFALFLLLLPVVAIYIVFTFARTAWVSCFFGSLAIFILFFDYRKYRFYLIIISAVSILLYFYFNYFSYEYGQRGLSSRDQIWLEVLSQMPGYWIWGHGVTEPVELIEIANSGRIFPHEHSIYLAALYQSGFAGLFLWVSIVLVTLFKLLRAPFNNDVSHPVRFIFSILLAAMVGIAVDLTGWISLPNLLWQWMWVPLAVSLGILTRHESQKSR